jgi:hypothetical protein
VRNGTLHIHPTFTADKVGDELVEEGGELDLWGTTPASQCTSNAFWGCYRTSGLGGNMINPIQSGRLRTYESFNFKYGRVEVSAHTPGATWHARARAGLRGPHCAHACVPISTDPRALGQSLSPPRAHARLAVRPAPPTDPRQAAARRLDLAGHVAAPHQRGVRALARQR